MLPLAARQRAGFAIGGWMRTTGSTPTGIGQLSRFRSASLWRCNTVYPFRDDPTTGRSRDRRRAVA
jgi:hypothetical protein